MGDSSLIQQLHVIATFLREDVKRRLIDDGHTATGELVDSIRTTVTQGVGVNTIDGFMAKQGVFIISGRNPNEKGVPIDALLKWIEAKGFSQGVDNKLGLAFQIQKSIKKKGIKPNDFIGKAFNENRGVIGNQLQKAVSDTLKLSITNMINGSKAFI